MPESAGNSRRIVSLQILRFVAALGVAINHATMRFGQSPFEVGPAGVDVFFVLSGFVITRAAAQHRAHFLADRFTRVFPIYWVLTAPWLAFGVLGAHPTFGRILATVTLWPATSALNAPYLAAGWTLSYEVLFYFSVWLCLRGIGVRWLLLCYGCLFVAARFVGWPVVHFLGSTFILEFIAGAAISHLRGRRIAGAAACVAGFAAMIASGSSATSGYLPFLPIEDARRVVLWGFPAVAVVWGAAQLDLRSPAWKPLALLGDASYSIYLSHPLVILAMTLSHVHNVALAAGLCVVAGVGIHFWLERPLLRDTRAFLSRLRFPQPEATAGSTAARTAR